MSVTLGIVGVGAIGGSIGLRARANGWRVLGYDPDDGVGREALARGVLDELVTRETLYARADRVAIAAHLDGTLAEVAALRARPARASLIVDVASVKTPVVAAAHGLANFVATHPMAGTERAGPGAARADMFEGQTWLYVPSGESALDLRAAGLIAALGGVAKPVDAREHDRSVAFTSHLPQIVAAAFGRVLREQHVDPAYCGPVAREWLRIAGMSGAMWEPILAANASNIGPALRALMAGLDPGG